jgi:hypothetical protein
MMVLLHNGQIFTKEDVKQGIVHAYYSALIDTPFHRTNAIDFTPLDMLRSDLSDLCAAIFYGRGAKDRARDPSRPCS